MQTKIFHINTLYTTTVTTNQNMPHYLKWPACLHMMNNMKCWNVPDKLSQTQGSVREDGPEEKSYFCTSHCHVSNILYLLELSQDSHYVQSPESVQQNLIYKKVKHRRGLPLKLLWWDEHDGGRDDQSGCDIRKDTCEPYGFGLTSRDRTNRSGTFTDKLNILGHSNVDRWHHSIKTRWRYRGKGSWLLHWETADCI